MIRAVASVPPPAPHGTMSVNGRSGYSWAMAGAAALTLGLATFLGPAAADELTGDDTAATEEAGSMTPRARRTMTTLCTDLRRSGWCIGSPEGAATS